jgi:hypothetical protein
VAAAEPGVLPAEGSEAELNSSLSGPDAGPLVVALDALGAAAAGATEGSCSPCSGVPATALVPWVAALGPAAVAAAVAGP